MVDAHCVGCHKNPKGNHRLKLHVDLHSGHAMLHSSAKCGEALTKGEEELIKHSARPLRQSLKHFFHISSLYS
jgi:hypothetical protein